MRLPSSEELDDSVGVGPVRVLVGLSIDVQMIELVPSPNGIVILVQVDEHVSSYGRPRDDLLCGRNQDQVAVRKYGEVMMRRKDGDIAFRAGGGSERLVDLRRKSSAR